ncbi:MAG: AbrB/MazE/SpoVT family DNA-binding domain-containing protein [Deltaproteobacteria bacterium]|nr:AbrB/MazE/SpoVT family DNA-binding domain-containing protein [Deltaproteobacteria bacterium]
MGTDTNASIKMKVFPKGQVVIPVALRRKHHIDIGDHIDVVSQSDGILLKPLPAKKGRRSLTDGLSGIFSGYAAKTSMPTRADMQNATEAGFVEGWNK